MSKHNPLTTIRHRKQLASMIVDTMKNEECSLLEAYVTLQALVSDEATLAIAKKKIEQLNGDQV